MYYEIMLTDERHIAVMPLMCELLSFLAGDAASPINLAVILAVRFASTSHHHRGGVAVADGAVQMDTADVVLVRRYLSTSVLVAAQARGTVYV